MKYLSLWLLFSLAPVAQGATLSVPCDFGPIKEALQTAKEGDIVRIGVGTCLWTEQIEINRGVSFSIFGAGTNETTLISSNLATGAIPLWIRTNGKKTFNIANFNVIGAMSDTGGFISVGGNAPATPMTAPTHIWHVRMTNCLARGISMGSCDAFGLIEYCQFWHPASSGSFNSVAFFGNEYSSWATPNPLGTTNVVCVENCDVKTFGHGGNGFFDCYNGAQMVWRHNTMSGTANNGAHGYDSQVTSVRTGEIYDNLTTDLTPGGATSLDWRGGTVLFFRNQLYGDAVPGAVIPLLKYYRGCEGIVNTISNWVATPQVVTWTENPPEGSRYPFIFGPDYVIRNQLTTDDVNQQRWVLRGATLAETISNLVMCINLNPAGQEKKYTAVSEPNNDVRVTAFDDRSLTLVNVQDGPYEFGWPAAQQHGVINVFPSTNLKARFPCYFWDNTYNAAPLDVGIGFASDACNGHNNVTNLVRFGRDVYADTQPGWRGVPRDYEPLVFPHPLSISQFPVPQRILSLAETEPFREGSLVSVPLQLESRGEVAGLTFDLLFDPIFLESPEIAWSDVPQNALVQANTNATGSFRGSFALSGTTVPAGLVTLGQIMFHASSVPEAQDVALSLLVRGIASISGVPLRDTLVTSSTVHLTKRNYIGDNNGNDRLDVGDASEIMRMVNQLSIPALWDVPANDLNSNGELDIGDVIRVLRVAAGIDPQPSTTNVQALHAFAAIADPPSLPATIASLTLSSPTGTPGQKITVRVNLSHLPRPISGASFVLHYPPTALRLEDSSSYRTTGLVPPNALSVWNLAPNQNDFALQNGLISLAVSSGLDWEGTDGAIAEFAFTVQQGATTQYLWPIQLSNLEAVSGSHLLPALSAQTFFVGRDPLPPTLSTSLDVVDGTIVLTLSGESKAQYRLEVSEDLKTWTSISVFVPENGKANITENLRKSGRRFYRVSLVGQAN
jgi:hypothetical protein